MIMSKIEQTKNKNPNEKNTKKLNDPTDSKKGLDEDVTVTMDM